MSRLFGVLSGRLVAARVLVVLALTALVLPVLVVPASAAPKPTVTLTPAVASGDPGKTVTFTGTVSRNSSGATVVIQRKTGSKWVKVGSGKVSKSKTFAITSRLTLGTHSYRARVSKNKKIAAAVSPTIRGTGVLLSTDSPAVAGESFQLTAQMPSAVKRKGVLEGKVNGSWEKIKGFTTSKTGVAKVTTSLMSSTQVRFRLPATKVGKKKYGSWSSPAQQVTVTPGAPVNVDPDVQRILTDINAFRASHQKPPLKLSGAMNTTAKAWSKKLHDTKTFTHRSRLSAGLPWGGKSFGENIAAGQQPSTVVKDWIDSVGHRRNMLGVSKTGKDLKFTHIGIGYYSGTKGYKRYFTTIFAAY